MRELLRRRVPHIVGGYLAASWGLLEFSSWAVDQYALSPELTNLVAVTLLVFLPMVAILAWRHGAPGQDAWTRVDAAVIGLSLVASGGILLSLFGGKELGAVTTTQVLTDEQGNRVERAIPKEEFRRTLLAWDFDNASGDPELDWLRSGLWLAFVQDLSQDLFMTPVDPTEERVRQPLAEAGFQLPYDIPLPLKRRLAEERGVGHFLTGEIGSREGDSLTLRTHLYETRNAREVASRTYRGADPFEIADRVSVDVRRDLGIPEWQIEESVDFPSSEVLTDSPEALKAFSEYRVALFQNRLNDAEAAARAATRIDSTFASAYGAVATAALLQGDQAAAQEGIADALRYAYRLPERARLGLRMLDRMFFRIDPDGALQAGLYWTELYPQDPAARRMLAQAYRNRGDMDGVIRQTRALLEMDPADVQALQAMAEMFRGKEEYDSALVYYARLTDLQPEDVPTLLAVAATRAGLLQFDAARQELQRARVAAPDDPEVLSRLARLDMQEGRYADAARHLDAMRPLARTPQQRDVVSGTEETFYYETGQYVPLREAHERRIRASAAYQVPIMAVQFLTQSAVLVYAADWDRTEYALREIDSLRASLEEPWSFVPDVAALQVYLDLGDVESARSSLTALRRLDEAFGAAPEREARIRWGEARLAEQQDGDCRRALEGYRAARELAPRSPVYRAWLASCRMSLESPGDAEEDVDWLLARYPGSAKVRVLAARFHAAQGRPKDAIAHLETALATWSDADPDFRPAADARAMLDELRGD